MQSRSPAYDDIADWYADYVTGAAARFTARAASALRETLGHGTGVCWDLACGTGVYADVMRDLGWKPIGTDISGAQLRHAAGRLPVAVGDATRPPVRPASVDAVASVLCHTDIDDYSAVCRSAAAALTPGGRFAHLGVHPCFVGPFADRSDLHRVTISQGYWQRERSFEAWSPTGVRARVGATHLPVSELVGAIVAAGLTIDAVVEAGEPTPDILGIRAHK
jgi:SAM-dependent methyltransferase